MTYPNQPNQSDPTWPAPQSPVQPGSGDETPMYGYATPTPQPAYYGPPMVVSQPTNGLAIASLIVSILGFGPVGAIMGHIARRQIKERNEQGDGLALAGIIVGWVTTAIWVLCCGGFAIAAIAGANIQA
jgi:Domain of unknown function (DUF4190)